ncbi:MAG: hypothetical protein HY646_06365 [Acidobacteria bacterium]|nr:hypothetical protein [Acidobacteriota bacterium]
MSPTTASPVVTAPSVSTDQGIQKVTLEVTKIDKFLNLITATDEFDKEHKIYYSPSTKIVTLGPSGREQTIRAILQADPQAEIFKKGDDLSVIWEVQGILGRVALKITLLE